MLIWMVRRTTPDYHVQLYVDSMPPCHHPYPAPRGRAAHLVEFMDCPNHQFRDSIEPAIAWAVSSSSHPVFEPATVTQLCYARR